MNVISTAYKIYETTPCMLFAAASQSDQNIADVRNIFSVSATINLLDMQDIWC